MKKSKEERAKRILSLINKQDGVANLIERILKDRSNGLSIVSDIIFFYREEYSFTKEEFYTFADLIECGGSNHLNKKFARKADSRAMAFEEYPFIANGKTHNLYIEYGTIRYILFEETYKRRRYNIDKKPENIEDIIKKAKKNSLKILTKE